MDKDTEIQIIKAAFIQFVYSLGWPTRKKAENHVNRLIGQQKRKHHDSYGHLWEDHSDTDEYEHCAVSGCGLSRKKVRDEEQLETD